MTGATAKLLDHKAWRALVRVSDFLFSVQWEAIRGGFE